MTDFLSTMTASSRQRAGLLNAEWDAALLDKPVWPLRLDRFDLIAELKDRSPAEGQLADESPGDETSRRAQRAAEYARGGAAAVSVLTEPEHFAGESAHLEEVVRALEAFRVPVMRKDFLTATVQVVEARAHGASGVLLIAAILDDRTLASMLDCAFELGMFVLLESFSETDAARSAALIDRSGMADRAANRQLLFGVNTRDLRSLAVDPERLERLAPMLPEGAIKVAESGIRVPGDAARAAAMGYRLGLVGTALMKSAEPAALVRNMLDAGRQRGEPCS